MKNHTVSATPNLFHSPLIPAAAGLYALAALLGVWSVGLLFLPESMAALIRDLEQGGITSASALQTWKVIHVGLILAALLGAGVMAVSLAMELVRPGRGLSLLGTAAQWMEYGVNALGIVALVVAIYRLVRYVWACLAVDAGVYYLYSMVVSEGLMVAQAVFLFVALRRFLNSLCDSAFSMAYTRLSGSVDSQSIPGLTATGFLVLALLGLYLAVERMLTVTIVEEYLNDHYGMLVAPDPILRVSAGAFLLGAAGSFLVFLFVRKYKRTTERMLYQARREILG